MRAKSENKYNWKTWFSYCPNVFVAYKQTKKIHFIHSFVCDWLDKQKQHYIAAFPLDTRHDGNSFPARRTAFWLARTPCCTCVNAWEVRYPVSSVKWKWGCSCGWPGHVLSSLTDDGFSDLCVSSNLQCSSRLLGRHHLRYLWPSRLAIAKSLQNRVKGVIFFLIALKLKNRWGIFVFLMLPISDGKKHFQNLFLSILM